MSIYIGNNGSEKILHIYDGDTNVRTDNFSGTSFHSSLPYIKLHSIHRFYPSGGEINASQGVVSAYKMNYVSSTSIPSGEYSIIICGMQNNGTRYTFPTSHGDGYYSNIAGSYWRFSCQCPAFRLNVQSR